MYTTNLSKTWCKFRSYSSSANIYSGQLKACLKRAVMHMLQTGRTTSTGPLVKIKTKWCSFVHVQNSANVCVWMFVRIIWVFVCVWVCGHAEHRQVNMTTWVSLTWPPLISPPWSLLDTDTSKISNVFWTLQDAAWFMMKSSCLVQLN